MFKIVPVIRGQDSWGNGAFGSPRTHSTRKWQRVQSTHNGVDVIIYPGSPIFPVVPGVITKFGTCYSDTTHYTYVQVTAEGKDFRYFYVTRNPKLEIGDAVTIDTQIGTAQDLEPRYKGITPHVHFEIKEAGKFIDPTPYVMGNV